MRKFCFSIAKLRVFFQNHNGKLTRGTSKIFPFVGGAKPDAGFGFVLFDPSLCSLESEETKENSEVTLLLNGQNSLLLTYLIHIVIF